MKKEVGKAKPASKEAQSCKTLPNEKPLKGRIKFQLITRFSDWRKKKNIWINNAEVRKFALVEAFIEVIIKFSKEKEKEKDENKRKRV